MVRMGDSRSKVAQVFTTLLNEGPKPSTDIDVNSISQEQRRDGVRKFHPRASSLGTVKHGGPMTKTPVYYIDGKHSPEVVIRTWIDANEGTVDDVGDWAIHQRICEYGEEWKVASRNVLSASPNDGGYGGGFDMDDCPLCGDGLSAPLSHHLPECPAR